MRPATPPPEFDLELAVSSIERIAALDPTEIFLTHFGSPASGTNPASPKEVCGEAIDALRTWADWIQAARNQTTDLDEVSQLLAERSRVAMGAEIDDAAVEHDAAVLDVGAEDGEGIGMTRRRQGLERAPGRELHDAASVCGSRGTGAEYSSRLASQVPRTVSAPSWLVETDSNT